MKAMTQQHLPKSLFLPIAIFSFFAFAAVNLHAKLSTPLQSVAQKELLQQKVEDATEQQADRDLNIPDITVLGRLFELAQRFLPRH